MAEAFAIMSFVISSTWSPTCHPPPSVQSKHRHRPRNEIILRHKMSRPMEIDRVVHSIKYRISAVRE